MVDFAACKDTIKLNDLFIMQKIIVINIYNNIKLNNKI